jgi:hypothetical protein
MTVKVLIVPKLIFLLSGINHSTVSATVSHDQLKTTRNLPKPTLQLIALNAVPNLTKVMA